MTVTEDELDLIAGSSGEREFTRLAETLVVFVSVDNLAQGRGFGAAGVILTIHRVKSSDGFNQSRLTPGRLNQTLTSLLDRGKIRQVDGNSAHRQ